MKRVVGFQSAQASVRPPETAAPASASSQTGLQSSPRTRGMQVTSQFTINSLPAISIDKEKALATSGRTVEFRCYAHHTAASYLPAIHADGLIAGKSRGMGDPISGQPIPHAIFVATGRGALLDTAACTVGVISTTPPEPDRNYPADPRTGESAAGVFHRDTIPALRDADPGDPQMTATPFVFTAPMTPRTVAGAGRYVRHLTGEAALDDKNAAKEIENRFKTNFPLQYRRAVERVAIERKGKSHAPLSPPEPSPSDDNLFNMDL